MQLRNLAIATRSNRLCFAKASAGCKEIQHQKSKKETSRIETLKSTTVNQQHIKAADLLNPFSPKSVVNHWKVSYKSADTFHENRYGIRSSSPLVTHPLMSSLCQSVLGYTLSHHTVHNFMVNQVRWFKAKRSTSTGFSVPSSTTNKTGFIRQHSSNKVVDSDKSHKENVDKLIKDDKLTPEDRAFAEGYNAAQTQSIGKMHLNLDAGKSAPAKLFGYFKDTIAAIRSVVGVFFLLLKLGLTTIFCLIICGIYKIVSEKSPTDMIYLVLGQQFVVKPETITVTFNDVRGSDEAKKELMNVVDFLKNPGKYTQLGAKLPNGCLLVGPPGVGKTLLARAVAGEAGVPFLQASGAEFEDMFVGSGAKKVRQMFLTAKACAPCVIFIDEIDSVGAKRTNSTLHPYANQTINQLLTEMDGFKETTNIVVIGATNKKENMDLALLRPGRFDVQVNIRRPNLRERESILQLYVGKIKCGLDVDIKSIAKSTRGCTGPDLEIITNHAAMKAAQDGKAAVSMRDIEYAIDKVRMGPQKSRIPLPAVNKLTAWHEAGHALVKFYQKSSSWTLHKITILPRGNTLGMTHMLGEERAEYQRTKQDMLADMDVCFGGRIAEEMLNGPDGISTGASADMVSASQTATAMVTRCGFSDKLGIRSYPETHKLSPKVQEEIDEEIKRLLEESYERARQLLHAHKEELANLAEALLEYEELTYEEAKTIIEGGKL